MKTGTNSRGQLQRSHDSSQKTEFCLLLSLEKIETSWNLHLDTFKRLTQSI